MIYKGDVVCARCGRKLKEYVVINGKYYGKCCAQKVIKEIQGKIDKWIKGE